MSLKNMFNRMSLAGPQRRSFDVADLQPSGPMGYVPRRSFDSVGTAPAGFGGGPLFGGSSYAGASGRSSFDTAPPGACRWMPPWLVLQRFAFALYQRPAGAGEGDRWAPMPAPRLPSPMRINM